MRSHLQFKNPTRLLAFTLLLVVGSLALRPLQADAHPLGNFTVNQYARIELTTGGPRVIYILDLAEVPAFQAIQQIDTDRDDQISEAEQSAYLETLLPQITAGLHLSIDGNDLPLVGANPELTFPAGQAGLQLLRLRTTLLPATAVTFNPSAQQLAFENGYETDRLGWREIVVTNGEGVAVDGVNPNQGDLSHELTNYPTDLLQSPSDQTAITFTVAAAPGAPAASTFAAFQKDVAPVGDAVSRPNGGSSGGHFASLLERDHLTTTGIVIALLTAMMWGAAHALSPGHGKTVVGAYLIGSRGTPRHAAFLGLTVTITHTAGVVLLGLVTLFASRYIVPETIFPWLSVASGGLVVAMGLWTLRMRLRGEGGFGHHHHHHDDHHHDHAHDHDHDHGHHHDHDHGHVHSHDGHTHSHVPPAAVTWRGLLALGVSGGLIPCPSALLVLLGAIALGRVGFGLALVVAFSLGLAATLTGLGLVFLYAGDLLESRIAGSARSRRLLRYAPAVGSVALTLAGIAIIIRALEATSLR